MNGPAVKMAEIWVGLQNPENMEWRHLWAVAEHERLRMGICNEAVVAKLFGLDQDSLRHILADCDHSITDIRSLGLSSKGFWRVDKDKDPELRHTVLTLVAFRDLEEKIRDCGNDCEKGIEAFLNQNDGQGWMLPETLRLADYDLGHDKRAKHLQPVASRLGPRFYDWQLAQSAEESWRECHLHARNLLGKHGYLALLAEVIRDAAVDSWQSVIASAHELAEKSDLLPIFVPAFAAAPVSTWRDRLDVLSAILRDRGFTLEPMDLIALFFNVTKKVSDGTRPALLDGVRSLMDESSHRELVARFDVEKRIGAGHEAAEPAASYSVGKPQGTLFD
jgi:hypothetical protein